MFQVRKFQLLVVVAAFSCVSLAAAQAPPPNGIDPVVVRLNGCAALTEEVVPFVVEQEGLGEFAMGQVNLLNTTANINIDFGDTFGPFFEFLGDFTFGVTFQSFLRSVAIDIPVDSDALTASFRAATAPAGRVAVSVNIPDATLNTTLRIRTRLNLDLPDFIPDQLEAGIRAICNVTEDFNIRVTGLTLAMRAALARTATSVSITQLEQFTPQVGSVAVTDSTGILALANDFSIAVGRIFGQTGTGTVTALATNMTNGIIRNNQEIRDMFQDSVNTAINRQSRVRGFSGAVPNLDGIPLGVTYAMASFATRINNMTTNWNLGVTATAPLVNPNLAYTYRARTAQSLSQVAAAGDLQAFLPLTMFDKFAHELARKGLFTRTLTLPASPITPSFQVQTQVSGTPRALAGGPEQIRWVLPISINNLPLVAANTPRLQGVTAVLEVVTTLTVDDRNGLAVTIDDINLPTLNGTVRVGGQIIQAAALRGLIEAQLLRGIAGQLPSLTVVPKVTGIMDPFAVEIGTVSVGSQYVNVPLSLVVNE